MSQNPGLDLREEDNLIYLCLMFSIIQGLQKMNNKWNELLTHWTAHVKN